LVSTKHDLYDRLSVVGKAFGSAKRLELVELLGQGERSVESLARAADMGLSTVSAHLQVLKAADLVATRREGTSIRYRLAGDDVAALYEAVRTVAQSRSAGVARALEAHLGVGDGAVDLVTREELSARVEDPSLLLLDVRPREEYVAGHVPGARSVPFEELAEVATHPSAFAGQDVVTYCRGAWCVLAHDAVRLLGQFGVPARRLEDGMLEWRNHGHPVEVGE